MTLEMANCAETVEVLIRSIAGDVVFGPRPFSQGSPVAGLRAEVLRHRQTTTGFLRIVLLKDSNVLGDDTAINGTSFECVAIFRNEELSAEQRETCIRQLRSVWYRSRPARAELDVCAQFSAFSEVARADDKVVQVAVSLSGLALEYADALFKGDRRTVLKAIHRNADALAFASLELLSDKQFLLQALRRAPKTVKHILPELFCDRDFVLQAVQFAPCALQRASLKLFEDRTFLLHAVAANRLAIGHVPMAVELDNDLLMGWIDDASVVAHTVDRADVLRKVSLDGMWLANAVDFQADREIVLAAVQQNPDALQFSSLTGDRDVVLAAVRGNGRVLEFADDELRRDHQVILTAIRSNPRARQFAIDKPMFHISDADCVYESAAIAKEAPDSQRFREARFSKRGHMRRRFKCNSR